MKDNAITLWKRFELSTTKLSLKLDEQLHHVMEPTVASKLQGDYKIGKRINMKKVDDLFLWIPVDLVCNTSRWNIDSYLTIFFVLKESQVIPYITSDYSKDKYG